MSTRDITIDQIMKLATRLAETEYQRGYADGLTEKKATEKHWGKKPEATIETILQLIRNDIDAYLVEHEFGSEYRDEIKAFVKTPWEGKE